jgi:hypothetical protein
MAMVVGGDNSWVWRRVGAGGVGRGLAVAAVREGGTTRRKHVGRRHMCRRKKRRDMVKRE